MLTIKLRRDYPDNWTRINPVLGDGEPGYEKVTGKFKIGDGVSRWTQLEYFVSKSGGNEGLQETLLQHITTPLPHPVYDDGPSFVLLYQNAKV